MNKRKAIVLFTIASIGVAILSRLIDHPANFVPLGAIALLCAYYLESKWSWLIPLAAMLVSDLFLGFYHLPVMLSVYASYVAIWAFGRIARTSETKLALMPATLFGSLTHFTLTNFAVWAFTGMYAKTLSGLILSYTMAIPFFKWTLAGDIMYTLAFVAMIELVLVLSAKKRQAIQPILHS